ncbi:MAG TPA: hypothetical protein PKW18_12445 [Candidatus Sumerlaeota bacterium]|nr:MAG: hypothetical protein BWY12_02602 [candidate division BRC1 bacterium ADurb.Bin183]HOE64862.1 hypothetical protein [Candidatus Sumerlaeota bacterium]HRR32313.1 hypothetical protein [Candidatus Sumerlaeia bacterium]HON49666.1 hypothetical protein [Candidatus Sumerlaeota bacterium]HOR64087.1 hypothetical protein [Candidatus Sumerlaeota bacterium]
MDKASLVKKEFLKYRLTAETLCLGERIRGSIFRPCLNVFTYTALVGALKERFPQPYRTLHAVGRFVKNGADANQRQIMTFSPRDRGLDISIIPLEIEFITNVHAHIYIFKNDFTLNVIPKSFIMHLGAMKSKGFGQCNMEYIENIPWDIPPQEGKLCVRIPEEQSILDELGIRNIRAPVYGYLFRPQTGGTGYYQRSLFEGSQVIAHPILLKGGEQ